ncbi:unnamed protein product [Tetraodon nigroviridis]|uniref:(spotted green pufferfish) hypothetical protein n=1 Tax=Tetraodon nigroviridis TaxID=99883 RepID=Q4S7S1_TETNG|nr:unnamed protein product [Tetraodon nigroviridis]
MEKNAESIQQLRQENQRLHKRLSEAIACKRGVIDEAFNKRGVEKEAYRNMSEKDALTVQDQKVLSKTKRLNAQKHITQTKQQHLEELRREYQRMKAEAGGGAPSADAHARKKEEEAMKLRAQENRLEKIQFKCKEAENITVNYQKVKRHLQVRLDVVHVTPLQMISCSMFFSSTHFSPWSLLFPSLTSGPQEESLTFQGILDSLEAEILKCREELNKMQILNQEARSSKKAAKVTS